MILFLYVRASIFFFFFYWHIQNPVKHPTCRVLQKWLTRKTLHLRGVTGFWRRLAVLFFCQFLLLFQYFPVFCCKFTEYCRELNKRGTSRSSHQRCSFKKSVFKIIAKFTRKHLRRSLFFSKVADLRLAMLLEIRLQHSCFPVNFSQLLGTPPSDIFWALVLVKVGLIYLRK